MEIVLIPIIAALVIVGLGKRNQVWISLLLSLIPLAILYTYFTRFGVDQGWKSIFDLPWISDKIRFTLGFDGLTGVLLLLTNLMVPVIVMSACAPPRIRNSMPGAGTTTGWTLRA